MKPWETLATATTEGGAKLTLRRRGDELVIFAGASPLMSSRQRGSEEALATLACARLGARGAPTVLVGGLGLGFTLRAALDVLPEAAQVVVSELVPELVDWNRPPDGPLAALAGAPLADPRVRVEVGDVGRTLRDARARFDAVLLDVDNGPSPLVKPSNAGLYGDAGLRALRGALRPGGVLALWSAGDASRFAGRLERHGFRVETHAVRARGRDGGARHVVVVGVAREARSPG